MLKNGDRLPERPVKNSVGSGTGTLSIHARILAGTVQLPAARTNSSVRVSGESFKNAKYAVLISGKNNDFPAGTVHPRSTGPMSEPARNHTRSTCRWAQCWPEESVSGFTAAGIPSAHCSH